MTRALSPIAAALVLLSIAPSMLAQQRPDWGVTPAPAPSAPPATPAPPAGGRPWLGIIVTQVEGDVGGTAKVAPGLSIARVASQSPAAEAGLKPGDVLLTLAGQIMTTPDSLVAAVKGKPAGTAMQATILRAGRTLPVSITLGAQPAGWEEVKKVVARVEPGDSLPSEEVDDVLLRFEGRQSRPWIGLETMDLEPGLRAFFKVAEGEGVLVSTVETGSPAAKAGLAAGDVVLEIAGRAIDSGSSLVNAVRELPADRDSSITYARLGTRRTTTLRAATRDIAVWNAEVEGVDRVAAIEALAAHQRREATRVSEMLEALRRGDSEVEASLGAEKATRDAELSQLRRELDVLNKRLAELERELARLKTGG